MALPQGLEAPLKQGAPGGTSQTRSKCLCTLLSLPSVATESYSLPQGLGVWGIGAQCQRFAGAARGGTLLRLYQGCCEQRTLPGVHLTPGKRQVVRLPRLQAQQGAAMGC